jgi:hypothetical protein
MFWKFGSYSCHTVRSPVLEGAAAKVPLVACWSGETCQPSSSAGKISERRPVIDAPIHGGYVFHVALPSKAV